MAIKLDFEQRQRAKTLRYADNSHRYGRLMVIKDGVDVTSVGNILAEMYA